jgi:hypothetical protein
LKPGRVLVYEQVGSANRSSLVWFDHNGQRLSKLGEDADYSNLELSRDGTRVLVSIPGRPASPSMAASSRGGATVHRFQGRPAVPHQLGDPLERSAFAQRHLQLAGARSEKVASGFGTFAKSSRSHLRHIRVDG